MKNVWILFFVASSFIVCNASDSSADVNAHLAKLQKTVLVLREPTTGSKLRFSSDGKLVSGGHPGTFFGSALIYVNEAKSNGSRIQIKGLRSIAMYDRPKKQVAPAVLNHPVQITIDLRSDQLQEVDSALAAVFGDESTQTRMQTYFVPNFAPGEEIPNFERGNNPVGTLDGKPVYVVKKGEVLPPRATRTPDPEFPEGERQSHKQGTTSTHLIVDEKGEPALIWIERTSTFGFDTAALDAISEWRFVPGVKDGKPVPVLISVEINFSLY